MYGEECKRTSRPPRRLFLCPRAGTAGAAGRHSHFLPHNPNDQIVRACRCMEDDVAKRNPRYSNGSLRRKQRERLRAQAGPCGICKGARGPIRYDQPSDYLHPLSFVVDEVVPVSRWREAGYASPEECALDPNNQQPAHWCCNAAKSDGRKRSSATRKQSSLKARRRDPRSREW